MLPPEVPKCAVCAIPSRKGSCAGCSKLKATLGSPVESLEFLTMSAKRDEPETSFWAAKEQATQGLPETRWGFGLDGIGKLLHAYLSAHAHRLFADDAVVTAVPSRAPVLAFALRSATPQGAPPMALADTGRKRRSWYQHTRRQPERLTLSPTDWEIDRATVDGRTVVVLDDVFVTGATLLSYAHALREHGASEIRALAVTRHLANTHNDFYDALRIARRSREWTWSPARSLVMRPGSSDGDLIEAMTSPRPTRDPSGPRRTFQ